VAHSLSAKKRIRQNATRRARNRAHKRLIKADVRKVDEAVQAGDSQQATEALKAAIKRIDKVAAKGTLHRNTASRKISRLQKRVNALTAKA
jgi:small subunit ribosomal protein S20